MADCEMNNCMEVDELPTITFKKVDEEINLKYPPVKYNTNPELCEEYIEDIFEHLKETEFNHIPSAVYMKMQNDINEKMRGILCDWLVEVHLKFKLLPETLFLTVNLIDRYLEKKQILRTKLQLVGVTSMLIACKYEEIYAPEVRDFVYITDKAYTKEEILLMENEILSTLNYNITVPSPLRFCEVYRYFLKMDECTFMFCKYLLELFLIEYKMLRYNPSLLAASTIFITLKLTKKEPEKILELSNYSEEKIKECSKDICSILDNVEKSSLQAIRKKYSLAKYLEVAKLKFN
jgi:cyclin B